MPIRVQPLPASAGTIQGKFQRKQRRAPSLWSRRRRANPPPDACCSPYDLLPNVRDLPAELGVSAESAGVGPVQA